MRMSELTGWLLWNTMRVLALLGYALITTTFVLVLFFMFEAGLAWIAFVVIGLVLLLLFVEARAARKAR